MLQVGEIRALAKARCETCMGLGQRLNLKTGQPQGPCRCAIFRLFRICHNKYRDCGRNMEHYSAVSFTRTGGGPGGRNFGRKNEEYRADFFLIASRTLRRGTAEHRFFKIRYIEDNGRAETQRALHLTRAEYDRLDDRVVYAAGKAFMTNEPSTIYPFDSYFSTIIHRDIPANIPASDEGTFTPIRPRRIHIDSLMDDPEKRTRRALRPPLAQAA